MKILFITDLYPIKQGETATPLALHNFVIEWVKQGHGVDVIKPNFVFNSFLRQKPFYKTGFYEFKGVKIFNVNYFTPFCGDIEKKLKKEAKRRRGVEAWQKIKNFYASTHPRIYPSETSFSIADYDILIAHMPSGLIFAGKLAKKYKKPLVCGVHCSDIEVLTKPLYRFYFKSKLEKAYKNAKKIACRSFVLQKKFSALMPEFAEKTFVAPSGIKETQNGKKETKPLTVITCSNLIKRKNIDELILAVKELEDFKLTVIGDGKEYKNLTKINASNVQFLGRLAHEKVLEEMQKADIFILPSVNETFGLVYLEAMASGCITVCTKNDGIDGIIKDSENGFLTEPSVEGIKETLLRIKNTQNLEQIRTNSLETVKNYTVEACAKKYLNALMG